MSPCSVWSPSSCGLSSNAVCNVGSLIFFFLSFYSFTCFFAPISYFLHKSLLFFPHTFLFCLYVCLCVCSPCGDLVPGHHITSCFLVSLVLFFIYMVGFSCL